MPLRTLRKFEQEGAISLESFLKIYLVLGDLDDIVNATAPKETSFSSIDDVLNASSKSVRKRGTRK